MILSKLIRFDLNFCWGLRHIICVCTEDLNPGSLILLWFWPCLQKINTLGEPIKFPFKNCKLVNACEVWPKSRAKCCKAHWSILIWRMSSINVSFSLSRFSETYITLWHSYSIPSKFIWFLERAPALARDELHFFSFLIWFIWMHTWPLMDTYLTNKKIYIILDKYFNLFQVLLLNCMLTTPFSIALGVRHSSRHQGVTLVGDFTRDPTRSLVDVVSLYQKTTTQINHL